MLESRAAEAAGALAALDARSSQRDEASRCAGAGGDVMQLGRWLGGGAAAVLLLLRGSFGYVLFTRGQQTRTSLEEAALRISL
jgi:hypothetical protein